MNIPERFQEQPLELYQKNQDNIYSFTKFVGLKNLTHQYQEYEIQKGSDIGLQNFKELSNPFSYEQNFKPLIEGWINKKTLNTRYQMRYFVLTPTRLCYYSDEQKKQLKGCFNMVSLLKYRIKLLTQENEIKLKICAKQTWQIEERYLLQLQFNEQMSKFEWLKELYQVMEQLQIKYQILADQFLNLFSKIPLSSILEPTLKFSSQFNFWNKLDISISQLYAYSSHLDVLLIRSRNAVSYLSRFFMRSYYDHVALILKSELHEIFIFQSIESRGVSLIDLKTFLKIIEDDCEQIGYRKLIVDQTPQEDQQGLHKGINLQSLEAYLNSLLGKKYELSLSKLLLDYSQDENNTEPISPTLEKEADVPKKEKKFEKTNNKKQVEIESKKIEKTYFCSQLIADIYLKFGVIIEGKSKDFWPKDFQEYSIKFKPNCSLSPIMNVCFK